MTKKTKLRIVIAVIAVLAAAAVTLSLLAALYYNSAANTGDQRNEASEDDGYIDAVVNTFSVETATDDESAVNLDKGLKPLLEKALNDASAQFDGQWSAYVYVPSEVQSISINERKMQAASVIKLFVMGKVYDEYDDITRKYGKDEIDSLLKSMITLSSNEDTDELIYMLGRGDPAAGRKKVTDYCKSLSLGNTSMGRMMLDDNTISDNYTSAKDSGEFLAMILGGELPHSKEMINLLKKQTRKNKIPDGVPSNVMTANKTGELEDVENDAAIVFAGKPYILCIMSDGVNDYQPPIDAIADMSTDVYNYLAPKLRNDSAFDQHS